MPPVPDARTLLEAALKTPSGHFVYESGHHGDLWVDLLRLSSRAPLLRACASEVARLARPQAPELLCGPLVGGAFLAQFTASELGLPAVLAEKVVEDDMRYRVPPSLRSLVAGKRVLLVDDAINAGAAGRSTARDLKEAGARVVAVGTLLAMGDGGERLAAELGVPLHALARRERNLWRPDECALCRKGIPLSFDLMRGE